jgi:hypothetical protein
VISWTKFGSVRGWAYRMAWALSLGLSLAIAVVTVLFGRVPLLQLATSLSSSLALAAVVVGVLLWWSGYTLLLRGRTTGRLSPRQVVLPGVPLAVATAVPMTLIYLSDEANHHFYFAMVHLKQVSSLTLLAGLVLLTLFLQLLEYERAGGLPLRGALEAAIQRASQPFCLLILLLMGLLQGAAYLTYLGNDFLRYWAIADALSTASPYPAMVSGPEYISGGMPPYLVDLPLFPALLAISFALFGHNTIGGYLPIVLSNLIVPPLTYLFFREVVRSRMAAFSLTALVVLFPPMRFYTLNWPVPDATFFAALMGCAWLFVRAVRGEQRAGLWLLFGLVAAAAALTRPEGAAYAGMYLLFALTRAPAWRHRILAGLAFALPVGAFSTVLLATFGVLWPQNWSGTVGTQSALGNWQVLSAGTLEMFASSIRLSVPELLAYTGLLLVLALVGSWPGLYRPGLVAVLMAPAWLNLVLVLMADPWVSGAHLWLDFFRHVSYPLPFLLLGAWIAVRGALRAFRAGAVQSAGLIFLNGLLIAGVLWNVHFLTKPTPPFGSDAGMLLADDRVNFADVVQHRLDLPVLEFRSSEGRSVPVIDEEFQRWYPAAVRAHYGPLDPLRRTTGTAYQTGTLYLYLFGLVLLAATTLVARTRAAARVEGGNRREWAGAEAAGAVN